jgi:hypothetical protein
MSENWRDKEPTVKQLRLIEEMQEFSDFPLLDFKGTTRGEAHDWIQQNWKAAHESSWAIEHGYE